MQNGEAHSNPFKLSHLQVQIAYGCSELNKEHPRPTLVIFSYPTFVLSSCLASFFSHCSNVNMQRKQQSL